MMEIVNIHFFAFIYAVIAFVYSQILTEPDMILYKIWKFCDTYLPEFLFKMLIDCFKCVSGQFALWTGIYFINYKRPLIESLSLHAYYICLTIFISIIISKIYEAIKGN